MVPARYLRNGERQVHILGWQWPPVVQRFPPLRWTMGLSTAMLCCAGQSQLSGLKVYRLQVYLSEHNLPQETNREKVEELVAYIWPEMRNHDVHDLGQLRRANAAAKADCVEQSQRGRPTLEGGKLGGSVARRAACRAQARVAAQAAPG